MKHRTLQLTRPGYAVAGAILVLNLIGLACIYATERAQAGGTPHTFKQAGFVLTGVVVALLVLRTGYRSVARYAFPLFIIALLLLVPLTIAKLTGFEFGGLIPGRRGAYRWIRFPGLQLQPSELMKVAYIVALAAYLRDRRSYRTLFGVTLPILLTGLPLLLILTEPDLGTVLLMVPVLFIMLFAAGARKRHLGLFIGLGIAVAPLLWTRIAPYQRLRITGVLLQSQSLRSRIIRHPEAYRHLCTRRQALEWELGCGMQMVRSKAALGSGGLFGEGWGHGTYVEYNFLPDRHNDFVFSLVGHQWGLFGCLVVLVCYLVIILAAAEIASVTVEPFGRLLAVGVLALMATQVLINIGMTVGLMPVTGMTLPFVSYGGSSLLVSFIAAALLVSVSQHRPFMLSKKPFEYRTTTPEPRPLPEHST